MKAHFPRVLLLKVAEVEDMIESLKAAKSVKNLNGCQRQEIESSEESLYASLKEAKNGIVKMPIEVILQVLRCATMTQSWLSELFNEFSVVRSN